ncbi:putative delta-60 repeat protein [Flavobacterium sp. 270]|uniref:T9SS sorting signal type C domain-containing protein n=1 Tax=Flavobacterium sp. 270 TaxID=2512114 RepID=UPI001064BBCE|nr:T9SS sorting signal type C domain-containing protein [Flavobacterium sp. 270]TDW46096.1 putative delta-60 repeat protein [Flavobacterium sp. 270]
MIKKLLFFILLIVLPFKTKLIAQQGKIDITFNTLDDGSNGDGFSAPVRTLLLQDENLIVGGDYLSLNGIPTSYFTRLDPDGNIDESFTKGTGLNGKVYATYLQTDGKILVGGSFTSYNGINAGGLIRLNADGSYDSSFNTSIGIATGIVENISMQADGKIIIVGSFTKFNNVTVNRIARLLPDGSLDNSFRTGNGTTALITSVAALPNGQILIAGNFTKFGVTDINKIARLNSDGSIDLSFNIGTGCNDNVNAIAVQSDGKIILGGSFTTFNEITANRIIRLNEDGTRDLTFLSGTAINSGTVYIIKVDNSGNIMVGGSSAGKYNGTDINRVIFLNQNGILNPDFDLGSGPASASVYALANDVEGSWYIGGSFSVFDGLNQGRLAKVDLNGEHDIEYLAAGIGFDNSVLSVLSLEDEKTMVFGNFKKFNGNPAPKIVQLLKDGTLDNTFNFGKTGANNVIKSAVLQSDKKVVFVGNFTTYNNVNCNRIARILSDGSLDNSFNIGNGFNKQVYAIAIQPDGKLIAVGDFSTYNGMSTVRILRLLQDGSKDPSFNVGTGADAIIETILIQPDGKILIGGRFNTFNGIAFPRLVRLNSDGSIDSGFRIGEGFDKNVYTLALQSDQKIIAGGSFTLYNKVSQKRILRLNTNGSLDTNFDSGIGFSNGDVRSLLVQPDDRILVGGSFSGTYKTTPSLRLIRLLRTGSFDPYFKAPLNNKLFAMSFTSNYRLIIGGNFNSVSGISKHRIARLKLCLESTSWNGSSWSNGDPSGGKEVFFNDNFADLNTTNVCSCDIDEGKKVALLSGSILGIEFALTGAGTLMLENASSLYQSDDDIINTGNIIYNRNSSPVKRYDLTYWSSPVTRTPKFTLHDLSPDTLGDKYYKYDPIQDKWIIIYNGTEEMIKGIGYNIRAPQTFDINTPCIFNGIFSGVPNNGPVSISLGGMNKWVLLGNPYPSAIYADQFIVDNKDNIYGTLYFWTHNSVPSSIYPGDAKYNYNNDDFASYNLTGSVNIGELVGTSAPTSENQNAPSGYIASAQSFFAKSKTALTANFTNSMRVSGQNSQFFKTAQTHKMDIEKHRLWLNFNAKETFKQILIGYVAGATNSWDDNYDGLSIDGNKNADFYSINEGKKLVIQGRELPFNNSDVVLLGYKSAIASECIISIDHADGDLSLSHVYLEDKTNNTICDLTAGNYTFSTAIGTFDDRFKISFTERTLGIPDLENHNNGVFVSVKDKIIKITSDNENLKEVAVYDISGKQIYQKDKIEAASFFIENRFFKNQILLLKVILENGKVENKKIIF